MENVVMKNLRDGVLTRSFWELLCEKQEWVFFSSLKSQRTKWDSSTNLSLVALNQE